MNERTVFIAALDIDDSAARETYLEEACRDNPGLRERVKALIHSHKQAISFLDCPPPGIEATSIGPITETPGTLVGPYKLLEQIGEGGFGVVFMAEQTTPVKRKVALKVIKPGMDTREVIARFEAERQALALMDHPNIAKVLDAGATDTGRPFFVMELVRGVPITEYCDEVHLAPRERLELFVTVCQAVQHAHQKGIIHRDIKPTNVLVALHDDRPVVKIIDFGVAKATSGQLTDKTLFTGFAQVIGTPLYMSPEQAALSAIDIDTRSDIYSLGVLLYELLTGTTPFDKTRLQQAAFDEVRRIIREEEPQKPSTRLSSLGATLPSVSAVRKTEPRKLSQLVRGDLDWIVMKALEKDRSRRYDTANGFAADVERYLTDEPVTACPPSAGYRFRKFARRNKGGLAVAALVLLFLLVVGSGVGWAVRDRTARQSRIAAQVGLILDDVERLEREQNWPEALAAARQAEVAAAGGEADAATAQRVRQRLKDLEFLDRLEQIRMQPATIVDGEFDNARADRDYARAFRDYGVDVEALAVEASIERLKARPELAIPLAAALDDWVVQRRVSVEDSSDWRRLVAVARGIDPDPLRDRLRSTWGRPVSDQETQDELRRLAESIDVPAQHPATLLRLSVNLLQVKDPDSALRVLRDAQYAYPGDFWLNFALGRALLEQKDYEGAVRFYTAAVSNRPNSADTLNNLGCALHGQQTLHEAVACYKKAVELDPENLFAQLNLGLVLAEQTKLDEAIACFKQAIELDPEYHDAWRLAAYAYLAAGDAASYRRTCRELVERFGQTDDPLIAERTAKVCSLAPGAVADFGAVERLAQVAVTGSEQDGNYHYFLLAKGLTADRAGRHAEAVRSLERFAPDAARGWDIDAIAFAALAMAQHRLGRTDEAKVDLAWAKAIVARNIPERSEGRPFRAGNWHDWLHAQILIREAEDLIGEIEKADAEAAAPRAVELSPDEYAFWHRLGIAHYREGNWEGAIAALERSCRLETATNGQGNAWQWLFLAMAHWQLGRREEARTWYDNAIELEQVWPDELRGYRDEAAALLGVTNPPEDVADAERTPDR